MRALAAAAAALLAVQQVACLLPVGTGMPALQRWAWRASASRARSAQAERGRLQCATDGGDNLSAGWLRRQGGFGVVITGGTRGLGYCMAREFLRRGDRVVVCGRGAPRVAAAVAALQREFNLSSGGGGGGGGAAAPSTAAVWGTACDVSSPNDVRALGAFARDKLMAGGGVHLWINNAGCAAGRGALMDADPQDIAAVVGTNTLGTLLCCREAMRTMAAQQNGFPGNVFNVDGAGVNGGATKRFAAYGATKRAMPQLTASLTAEIKEAGLEKRVQVHTMSPGMVLTDLLLEGSEPNTRKLFNALAEEPDTVAADLVPRLREVDGEKGSAYIKFLTTPQALGRLALGAPQILAGGRFFDGKGERVKTAGAMYKSNGARKFYAEEDE